MKAVVIKTLSDGHGFGMTGLIVQADMLLPQMQWKTILVIYYTAQNLVKVNILLQLTGSF
jgi:hypothetical protein